MVSLLSFACDPSPTAQLERRLSDGYSIWPKDRRRRRASVTYPISDSVISGLQAAVRNGNGPALLSWLTERLRDGPPDLANARVDTLSRELEQHPEWALRAGDLLRRLLREARVGPALTESGISSTRGFAAELAGRVMGRLLPDLDDPQDLRTIVRQAFDHPADEDLISSVPDETWCRLLSAFGIAAGPGEGVDPELETAIRTLAHHIGSLGMQPEFTRRLPHLEATDSPFLALSDRLLAYSRSYANDVEDDEPALLREALETVERCRREVAHLRATKDRHGTSLELTGITLRLLQLLDRLELLLHLTDPVQLDFQAAVVRLFRQIVHAERTRNHVAPHLRARADLLAFQVVEHAARKGSKYITQGRRDYGAFFVASLGGGFFVALFSFVKTVIGGWSLPLGVEGLLYGLNYSACFVLIYLTGSALATKQPAMTANTIAQALGERGQRDLRQLETLVVRVWRSQFVSFAGNLLMALPVAFLVSEAFYRTAGHTVADPDTAVRMLEALHPWQSLTVVYAAVAGLFLYLAGLISGWVDNRNLYSALPDRVANHPWLTRMLGSARARDVGSFLDRRLGALAGNVFLGFALGSTGTIGEILGLPLDIRHIAFASAEFGTSLEILHLRADASLVWPVALGVLTIGLVNFLVSFGLSLATALESRNITWSEARILLRGLVNRFFWRPLDWFFPPKVNGQDTKLTPPLDGGRNHA